MVSGINKQLKKLAFFTNSGNISAYLKRKKLMKKYAGNNIYIGLFSSINNSIIRNNTYIGARVSLNNSELGEFSYINSDTSVRETVIGKFCSIGSKVVFGLGKHPMDLVSTHPAFYSNNKGYKTFSDKNYFREYFPINVGNDVWIGYGAIIMGGTNIGDGAVVAAGAVVTKDVEPYSIVGGVPAKHIKYRFEKAIVDELLILKWWDFDENWLKTNFKLFHNPQNFVNKLKDKNI